MENAHAQLLKPEEFCIIESKVEDGKEEFILLKFVHSSFKLVVTDIPQVKDHYEIVQAFEEYARSRMGRYLPRCLCPHDCEKECTSGDFDEPITVRDASGRRVKECVEVCLSPTPGCFPYTSEIFSDKIIPSMEDQIMHELSILIEVVRIVEELAEKQGLNKVETIVLQVGELSSVVPQFMVEYFSNVVDGKPVFEGTKLEIETLPSTAKCLDCQTVFRVIKTEGYCPKCRSFSKELLSGQEFFIKEILVPNE